MSQHCVKRLLMPELLTICSKITQNIIYHVNPGDYILYLYFMQKEDTSADKAHRFCTFLFRTSDNAFSVLISALKVGQAHIAEELLEIERATWVQTRRNYHPVQRRKVL